MSRDQCDVDGLVLVPPPTDPGSSQATRALSHIASGKGRPRLPFVLPTFPLTLPNARRITMPPRRHYPMDATETLSTDSLDKEYNYETDHFYLNLGPRRQEIKYPAYGLYGAVDGTVLVTKECSNILSVTVTVSPVVVPVVA